tara:strand:- start:153 stop:353 length:201 start_codon:yes stop_codon:yes gene_type:complete
MKITKDSTLENVLKIEGAEEVLSKFNFPCLTCPMAQMEMNTLKIGNICNMYGIDLEKVLESLNKLK